MQFYISDDEVKLAYRSIGNGPERIAMVHGFNCTSRNFDWMLPYFPPDRYTILLPDLRGSGYSDKPETGYTIERFARDLLGMMQAEGWENYTLVGHDTGGAIAQRMAVELDATLKALVLVDPVPAVGGSLPADEVALFRAAAASPEGKAAMWQVRLGQPVPGGLFDTLMADSLSWRREALQEMFEAWYSLDFEAHLAVISAPTLVVGADNERFMSESFLREMVVAKIPSACFVRVPHSNHYMHIEQAAYTAGLLAAFIAAQS